ncbi:MULTISPECIES: hypothetical protein [Erwiniaceae]|uniref:Uncharacterized protein n=1 Tax=Pantoea coffeiphila TaxID=1465635 RepID=A0A2S9I5N9_9GAMM|nr:MULTISPECIES: hypothetical protein [Erwiniaceae]MCW1877621.1 hypothetical protein [Erwinia sp. INIA01]PRD13123.1 hypothetical protein CQW29_22895 [Pantoea coffeiphila]
MQQPQQPMGFVFNPESAKKAGTSAMLNETGAYEGVILHAHYNFGTDSQSQTLELGFESNGLKANYLRINFINREGEQTFGMDTVSALLWAAGVRDAQPQQRQTPDGMVWALPAIEGKSVGLVLQKELRTKSTDGSDTYQMNIRHVFQVKTRLTYAELADKVPAEAIDKLLLSLKDVDKRQPVAPNGAAPGARGGPTSNRYANQATGNQQQSRLQQNAGSRNVGQQPSPETEFDDDIPF